jgi:RNA polymerase sigma-70 factor (ECF subfamily)
MSSARPASLDDLLARTALRDQTAYHALYQATAPKLFGFALRILKRRELAEECLQDAFVSVWYRAGDYRSERAQPFTWMAAIVRNRALDMLRATPVYQDIADDEALDALQSDAVAPPDAADETQALRRCLETLPAAHRQAIALSYYRGLAHAELAKSLREPLGTVKTWIRRGLMQLKRCLEQP